MSNDRTHINDPSQVRDKQYANSEKLAARARLHRNYTIADEGWFQWVAKRFGIVSGARVIWAAGQPGSGQPRRVSCRNRSS